MGSRASTRNGSSSKQESECGTRESIARPGGVSVKSLPWDQVQKSSLGFGSKMGSSMLKISSEESQDGTTPRYFSCLIQGFKKDQDRFVFVPQLLETPFMCFAGVFDGHGRDGDLAAETAAVRLPQHVKSLLEHRIGNAEYLQTIQGKAAEEKKRLLLNTKNTSTSPSSEDKQHGKDNSTTTELEEEEEVPVSASSVATITTEGKNDNEDEEKVTVECGSNGMNACEFEKLLEQVLLKQTLIDSFASVQKEFDDEFEEEVVKPSIALKKEIEAQQNIPLGELTLPLGSGTTATVFLVHDNNLYTAFVGDSRAVLCEVDKAGDLCWKDLSRDQNVANADAAERKRIEDVGGSICGKHLAGNYVDGMLQLTRSLGDVPLHRQGLVLHEPAIEVTPISPTALFAIAASDGLWDYFTSEEAVGFVHSHVKDAIKSKPDKPVEEVLLQVSQDLQNESANRASAKGRQSDDTSILILSLNKWWP